nr:uncharacterized protein LOC129381527 [Dermacentor andersoni]
MGISASERQVGRVCRLTSSESVSLLPFISRHLISTRSQQSNVGSVAIASDVACTDIAACFDLCCHFAVRRIFPLLVVLTSRGRTAGSSYVSQQREGFPVAHGSNNGGTNSRAKLRFPRDKLRASQSAGSRREPTHLRGRVGRGARCTVSGLHPPSRALLLLSSTVAKSWTAASSLTPTPLSPRLILCSSITIRWCTLL